MQAALTPGLHTPPGLGTSSGHTLCVVDLLTFWKMQAFG